MKQWENNFRHPVVLKLKNGIAIFYTNVKTIAPPLAMSKEIGAGSTKDNVLNEFNTWKQKRKGTKRFRKKNGKSFQKGPHKRKDTSANERLNIEKLQSQYDQIENLENFDEYPLSDKTKDGLKKSGYLKPTSIQKASLSPTLQGKDILGAAKTGSGKTLAFIVPILECLYRNQWSNIDGPGALVISPTRELAFQIFDVLQKVGCKHSFSAGLIIGGKSVQEEATRIQNTNIVVCTPGRLLQHLDATSYFHLDNLKMLVLDEADQILEMGFAQTINAVIENLPRNRQTLLYSATQTQSVKDLARLSLQNPVYVSVHADALHSTPAGLKQRYVVCELFNKLNILYSFVRNHLKCKTLVFLSSCKQVQYYFSVFCRLRPGIPVMHLHGRMNQQRRLSVYQEFSRKAFALLLSTDLAARGLDFPSIDWVLQVDCPENPRSYIHRVGRTARFHGDGNALLMLLPSEKNGMLQELQKVKVPVLETVLNTDKTIELNTKLQSFCAEDKELKEKAQRCFKAYIRSVHLMKNKEVFCVPNLPLEKFALSLGLACPPRVRFLQQKTKSTNVTEKSKTGTNQISTNVGWMLHDDEDKSDLFTVKPDRQPELVEPVVDQPSVQAKSQKRTKTKIAEAKRLLKKGMKMNQKITFDESGDVDEVWPCNNARVEQQSNLDLDSTGGIDVDQAKLEMARRDVKDRLKHKERIQEKHKEARKLAKESRRKTQSKKESGSNKEEETVCLGGAEDDYASSDDNEPVSDESSGDEDFSPPRKQRRIVKPTEISTGFSLADEEDLAMRLLNKTRNFGPTQ